mmetsp:Transcript_25054/g.58169  ORF Transcript_25054/g.58169 Transcript_25054/m.58169 type:complete len:275 (-) Transcript_25054:1162-1986(-)
MLLSDVLLEVEVDVELLVLPTEVEVEVEDVKLVAVDVEVVLLPVEVVRDDVEDDVVVELEADEVVLVLVSVEVEVDVDVDVVVLGPSAVSMVSTSTAVTSEMKPSACSAAVKVDGKTTSARRIVELEIATRASVFQIMIWKTTSTSKPVDTEAIEMWEVAIPSNPAANPSAKAMSTPGSPPVNSAAVLVCNEHKTVIVTSLIASTVEVDVVVEALVEVDVDLEAFDVDELDVHDVEVEDVDMLEVVEVEDEVRVELLVDVSVVGLVVDAVEVLD